MFGVCSLGVVAERAGVLPKQEKLPGSQQRLYLLDLAPEDQSKREAGRQNRFPESNLQEAGKKEGTTGISGSVCEGDPVTLTQDI